MSRTPSPDDNEDGGAALSTEPNLNRNPENTEPSRSVSSVSEGQVTDEPASIEQSSPDGAPPLPQEAPPINDDGWDAMWDERVQAYYFFNRFTSVSQWDNPRVPQLAQPPPPGVDYPNEPDTVSSLPPAGGYNPAIHGSYDPDADYAKVHEKEDDGGPPLPGQDATEAYAATGHFNRFTGKWQAESLNPENFNDENKSKRQMNAFFDVDAAANSHDGKSLKAERSNKKLTKKEVKAFKDKRREKKEEKRRAWLRD